jgi:hypothetical protein
VLSSSGKCWTDAVVLLEPDHVLVLVLLELAGDLRVGNDVEDLLGRVRQLRVLLLDLGLAGLKVYVARGG